MKPFARADRVATLIREALSDILRREIKDPRLEGVLITGVSPSRDLKTARVYFAPTGGAARAEGAAEGFEKARGFIKRTLARELDLRYLPELRFFYDTSFDYGERIEAVLKSLKSDERTDSTPPEEE
ncbi:MAG: 30S ribosome-binding factor RbfA [Desulfococcaceae bacterium]